MVRFFNLAQLRFGQFLLAAQVRQQADEVRRRTDPYAAGPARLRSLRGRADQAQFGLAGMERGQQYPRRGDDAAVERQFVHWQPLAQFLGIDDAHCAQQRQRDRQVIVRTFIGQVCG
jgi:hypothetical protein